MATSGPTDHVSDDEIVYRRVSDRSGWYDSASDRPVAWEAFRPGRNDVDGLSVWRSKYMSAREAAAVEARPGRRYFILQLPVGGLRRLGIEVLPTPDHGGPAHASLPTLNQRAYKDDKNRIRELAGQVAALAAEYPVLGPFGPFEAET